MCLCTLRLYCIFFQTQNKCRLGGCLLFPLKLSLPLLMPPGTKQDERCEDGRIGLSYRLLCTLRPYYMSCTPTCAPPLQKVCRSSALSPKYVQTMLFTFHFFTKLTFAIVEQAIQHYSVPLLHTSKVLLHTFILLLHTNCNISSIHHIMGWKSLAM